MSYDESLTRSLRLGGATIEDGSECYVIAEIGHNHQGSVERCKDLFKAAADAGAHAVKLQKRHNRGLFTQAMFDEPYNSENAFGATYGEHREYLEFGRDEFLELKAFCASLGIDFFSTAFDRESVDFLEDIDLPAYKLASGDIANVPLLRYVAQTRKPVIISTGGARVEDVRRAHDILANETEVAVLQCTAGYPAAWDELDLTVIETFRRMFPESVVGLSSHDNGIAMAVAAYVLGARIVEKHFTIDRTWRGSDHKFSLEPQGMQKMVRDLKRTRVALGDGTKKVYDSEKAPIRKMAKKLVAARPLRPGQTITPEDLGIKSPADGLCPSNWDLVVGGVMNVSLEIDDSIALDQFDPPQANDGAVRGAAYADVVLD